MGWRTIVVNKHSKLSYKNNHLVYKDPYTTEMIHLSEVDTLLLETTDISITTMLMKRLVDENILVIFCDDKRLPTAMLQPFHNRHDSSLQIEKQINWSLEQKQNVWTEVIRQKISNQGQFLNDLGHVKKARAIERLQEELLPHDPNNREGHAARIYFNTLFGQYFTREVETEINAGLNYGYTLIMSMFAREIAVMGCMTQIGLKHANQYNPYNLASDIMEPFRIIVDQIIYENKDKSFPEMKIQLFTMFQRTYYYNNKDMYLTNIVRDYTKKVIKAMNSSEEGVPVFRI